jgi:ABC-type Fe3+/spermidine/putrescine transport system ATPase subunit
MPRIELKEVARHICRGVDLRVENGELMVLMGPTGAGKTTLLDVIAGLVDYEGSVLFDGRKVDDLPPKSRSTGYLMQDLALFPHLDVRSNVAFGLGARKVSAEEERARVDELLELVRIGHLKNRYPKNLSGGEKRRVALARALAPRPDILLLDEPLVSLDPATAKRLRSEIGKIIRKSGITAVYVTHDMNEAEEIADRIALIFDGEIRQVGKAEDIFFNPAGDLVHEFIGMPNIIECDSCRVPEEGLVEIDWRGLRLVLPYEGDGAVRKIAVFPRDIYLSKTRLPGPGINRFEGRVESVVRDPPLARVKVDMDGRRILAEMSEEAFGESGIEEGDEVHVIIKMRKVKYVETENEQP